MKTQASKFGIYQFDNLPQNVLEDKYFAERIGDYKEVTEDSWNFEVFTSTAINYLANKGIIQQNEKGDWSWKN